MATSFHHVMKCKQHIQEATCQEYSDMQGGYVYYAYVVDHNSEQTER